MELIDIIKLTVIAIGGLTFGIMIVSYIIYKLKDKSRSKPYDTPAIEKENIKVIKDSYIPAKQPILVPKQVAGNYYTNIENKQSNFNNIYNHYSNHRTNDFHKIKFAVYNNSEN